MTRAKKLTAAVIVIAAIFACVATVDLARSPFAMSTEPSAMYVYDDAKSSFGYSSGALNITDGSDYRGPLADTYQFDLQPDTYTFTVNAAVSADASFELFSPRYASEDNESGRVFASAAMQNGVTTLTYTATDVIRGARLRVTYNGGETLILQSIHGTSRGDVYSDAIVLPILIALSAAAAIYVLCRKKPPFETEHSWHGIALVIAALIATLPLWRLGLPYAHDLTFHLARIEGVYETLKDGAFPARLNMTFLNGYGYADPTMYPPTFLYFPALLRLLRVSPIVSYQLFILAINAATAFCAYFAFTKLTKSREIGLVAAIAYTLAMYRIICVFTRAAVGELLAMAFLPIALLGLYELFYAEKPRAKCAIIGFTGIINAHVVSLDVVCVLTLIFALVNAKRVFSAARLPKIVRAAGVTLLLNAWILVPMVSLGATGLNVTSGGLYPAANDAVFPFEMFATFVRTMGLSNGVDKLTTGMPLTVGAIFGLGALLFLLTRFFPRDRKPDAIAVEHDALGVRLVIVAAAALYFASTLFPWRFLSSIPVIGNVLAAVQFPWRYFSVATVALAVVYALAAMRVTATLSRHVAAFVCCAVVVLGIAPYLDAYMQDDSRTAQLADKHSQLTLTYIGGAEYLYPETSLKSLIDRAPTVTSWSDITISNYEKRGAHIEFDLDVPQSTEVILPVLYYAGWHVELDGGETAAYRGNNGLLAFAAKADGANTVHVTAYYSPPALYRIAEIVSAATVCAIAISAIRKRKTEHKTP